jgi:cell division protein FtsQ
MEISLPFPHRSKIDTPLGARSGTSDRPAPRRKAVSRRGRRGRGGLARARTSHALELLRHNRLALRVALCALVSIPLFGGGWLWLRDSSLVAVRHVHIVGVHGIEAVEIRTALDNAATRMTTMDFDVGALRSAVASFTVVGGLRATTSFPHTVSISVTERPPVAALLSTGQRTAVAADGTVLGPAQLSSSLPVVNGAVEPAAGARLSEATPLAAVAVLGATPTSRARVVARG